MKAAGLLFLVPAGLASIAGADDAPPSAVSRETKAHISEGIPTFQPKPVADPNVPDESVPTAFESNMLVLPKLTVKERRLPVDAAIHMGNPDDYNRKMANLYLDELERLGPLNSILNRFTIPLLSPSRAERGKAIERNRELDRLSSLLAPTEAKQLDGLYDETALTLGSTASPRR